MEKGKAHLEGKHPLLTRWNFTTLDINKLERCEVSAEVARDLGIAKVPSTRTVKVLYEVMFPPHMRGQTRYLQDRKSLETMGFTQELDDYLDQNPVVTLKMNQIINKHYNKDGLACLQGASSRQATNSSQGHPHMIHRLKVVVAPIGLTPFSGLIHRPLCINRVTRLIKLRLAAEMDVLEFLVQLGGEDAATEIGFALRTWMYLSTIVAEPDIARAMSEVAQDVLNKRSDFTSMRLIEMKVANGNGEVVKLESCYSSKTWQALQEKWSESGLGGVDNSNGYRVGDLIKFPAKNERFANEKALGEKRHGSII
ncbi:hypothetical protein D6D28_10229 [Aureobasidium pullulans]|uniref:Uncharacterized protein n=1 Tax=Aureobasidium pullulans TaxID=5580 RepID=A0A4S8RZZ4_AURPU|nr:hypothetical protein D6D28_10229 [Aureobasidium pullulans]